MANRSTNALRAEFSECIKKVMVSKLSWKQGPVCRVYSLETQEIFLNKIHRKFSLIYKTSYGFNRKL
jgi:hypothetical protein